MFLAVLSALVLISCNNTTQNKGISESKEIMDNSNIKLCDVEFTKLLNIKDGTIQTTGDALMINAGERTDLFCDPKGVATNTTAPPVINFGGQYEAFHVYSEGRTSVHP